MQEAEELMVRFAERTGLTSDQAAGRYLWTDAFAVCNFLGLAHCTSDARYADLALRLVGQVHRVLGRFHPDDPRTGWLSGLPEHEAEAHPTRGGLRIGKRLPERGVSEPFDDQLEWERDGQYFHYLTKWMHALDQVSRWTGEPRFNAWGRELAQAAHRGFTVADRTRMVWKMSTDLSRPLVSSMGHHDPLDGLITCLQLQATAEALTSPPTEPTLEQAVADFTRMTEGRDWATADPLGLGGLLVDAYRVAELMRCGAIEGSELVENLLGAAWVGLSHYAKHQEWRQPAFRRLAFRELGLAIGLAAVQRLQTRHGDDSPRKRIRELLVRLEPYSSLGAEITSFWLDPEHRKARTWSAHRNINDVMLATSLVDAGMLPEWNARAGRVEEARGP